VPAQLALDVAATMRSPSVMMTRRSTKFWSWRTLPGHGWPERDVEPLRGSSTGPRPLATAAAAQKWTASGPMCPRAALQRRDPDRHDVEAEEQVLAERALADQRLERLVRGRDERAVDCSVWLLPEPLVLALLQQLSILTWTAGVTSPISSRKSVPPSAASTRPGRRAGRAVEGALLVAEELALDEASGNAAHCTRTNGPSRAAPPWWMARAATSLPVPLSPRMSTVKVRPPSGG
jgi:hypothetical protein